MYSPYYRLARPPDQPGQQRRFNKIQFSGHTGTMALPIRLFQTTDFFRGHSGRTLRDGGKSIVQRRGKGNQWNLSELEAKGKLNELAKWAWFTREFRRGLERINPEILKSLGISWEALSFERSTQ
jgi:hypothetical protein